MTPRLAEILAAMVDAVLDAEDALATGGNIAGRREAGPHRRLTPEKSKPRPAKEAAS